jgi:hypothetical protein
MPITLPKIDDRRFDDLVSEALARTTVHTPEWTNYNRSDPGVTLIEVFAFLTESLLYRANQIPERNRKKFLQLLRIPLQSATAAQGIITVANEAASTDPEPLLLTAGLEVRAGETPFRTIRAVDVLPVEGRFYVKKKASGVTPELKSYYQQLYASYRGTSADLDPQLYEATPFPMRDGSPIALSDTIDNRIWLALLVRDSDAKSKIAPELIAARIANRTLTLGVVPSESDSTASLPSGRTFGTNSANTLRVEVPNVPASGGLSDDIAQRIADYRPVDTRTDDDLLAVPGTADVSLPDAASLRLWNNIDPLEAGVDDLPPSIEDTAVDARVITWLRISPSAPTAASLLWMGINAVPVTQRARVAGELLPPGNGEPDQLMRLSLSPVLPESVTVSITTPTGENTIWTEIDDLFAAGAEVPVPDPRLAPGAKQPKAAQSRVFALNAESGEIRFGDGVHGARPSEGSIVRATYEYAAGAAGNVGANSISSSPSLPPGFKVNNPVRTWGGADAESVEEGEKQIARYLQHRDRLVTAGDFVALTLRTPGVDVGRVEVLPNYHPDFGGGEVPGVVTLMLVPATDPQQPDAPLPRKPFLDAVCRWLDPRRLVTTEVVLRGPDYQGIWISIGIKVAAGFNETEVTEAVKADLLRFLAPTAGGTQHLADDPSQLFTAGTSPDNGWTLGKAVVALELAAVANRTRGVEFVQQEVVLADANGVLATRIGMTGLALPRVLGIRVTNGAAASLDDLRGVRSGSGSSTQAPAVVQVPKIPEECR